VTFIGYKIAGISGALTATLSIFLPSGILMLLVSHLHERIKHLKSISAIMTGIRAVVIGLILSGAYTVGLKHFGTDYYSWSIFSVSLLLSVFTKIHPAILIGITLAISFI
jgi:chromate transporter